eukprot:COSAG04_NODE_68_length_29323_cov_9.683514_16_plen_80_part_00
MLREQASDGLQAQALETRVQSRASRSARGSAQLGAKEHTFGSRARRRFSDGAEPAFFAAQRRDGARPRSAFSGAGRRRQ